MMLGKRGRPPMRRTTSMTGITVDIGTGTGSEQEPSDYRPKVIVDHHDQFKGSSEKQVMMSSTTAGGYDHQYFMAAMVSPRYQRRISGEGFQTETANFLRTCGLCNRRLAPGRDIYMYRSSIFQHIMLELSVFQQNNDYFFNEFANAGSFLITSPKTD
nr:FCS-Like Zinc finger 5-like isoform X3 [Nicotiana tomentosiformis]